MENENTKVNIKHYIGKTVDNPFISIPAIILFSTTMTMSAMNYVLDETPDNIGTENQTAEYSRITNAIKELGTYKAELEIKNLESQIAEAREQANSNETKNTSIDIDEMNKNFYFDSYRILNDIYTHGDVAKEADISEANVIKLTELFESIIAPVTDFGIDSITPENISNLDECRIELGNDGNDRNFMKQFKDVSDCTDDERKDKNDRAGATGALALIASAILSLFGVLNMAEWKDEPSHIPKKRKNICKY